MRLLCASVGYVSRPIGHYGCNPGDAMCWDELASLVASDLLRLKELIINTLDRMQTLISDFGRMERQIFCAGNIYR
jgi:hypothetical protein